MTSPIKSPRLPMHPPRRVGAFTLLELLVAMGIVVILAATLTATLGVAFKMKNAAENAIEKSRDVQIVGDEFVGTLANAMPPNPAATQTASTDATGATTVVPNYLYGSFYGDSTSVTFYATGSEPKSPFQADARYVEFGLSNIATATGGSTTALVRRVNPDLLSDTSMQDVTLNLQEEVLVLNVLSVQFLYYDGTNWLDTWSSADLNNTLPLAVAMELTLAPTVAGDEPRVIKRFAYITCAVPATQDAAAGN